MGYFKNQLIDREEASVPFPVNLYDPPIVPAYGDEDAPKREGLTFVEWMTSEAHNFRILGTEAGRYLAGVIEAKVQLCQEQGIGNPISLVDLERRMAEEDHRCLMAALEMPR